MFHIHKWGKWSDTFKTEVMKAGPGGIRRIAAYIFIQSRTCEKCGLVKYKEKRIYADN